MFFQVVLTGFVITGFAIFIGFLFGWSKGGLTKQEYTIDNFRRKCKEDGLVLHIPSYKNGVEAYVTPNAENFIVPETWLKRF